MAPARDAATAMTAIEHGADAVYIGASSHGARSAAGNSVDDIKRVVEAAHRFDARVYVTVNTIVYDNEIDKVVELVRQLYHAGVDALIVQDVALLEMPLPPIQLHASTQMDTRSVQKALWLSKIGFSQVVMARESSLADIRAVYDSGIEAKIEAFVHGALCVSYSGDCQAGWVTARRSANRGECPQVCRYRFDLVDGKGNRIIKGKHLLSLKDLNLSARIAEMADAGVSSFKIEGRLKDTAYVKNAVLAYRRIIDRIIADTPGRYCRASAGRVESSFEPSLGKGFNRGFTSYFIDGPENAGKMASADTPKMVGERVGRVIESKGDTIKVETALGLHNGDGIGFMDGNGMFAGAAINRVDSKRLYLNRVVNIKPGITIYRNRDKQWDDELRKATARRSIGLSMSLRNIPGGLALDIADERDCRASVSMPIPLDAARSPQEESRRRVLAKLGGTIYRLDSLTDTVGALFVPASSLATLRRAALEALEQAHRSTFKILKPAPRQYAPPEWELTRHDNIANSLARRFYEKCGVKQAQAKALEVDPQACSRPNLTVMTTRYCLRREMNRCLKTPQGKLWPDDLYLQSAATRFKLNFDCRDCLMKVVANPGENS